MTITSSLCFFTFWGDLAYCVPLSFYFQLLVLKVTTILNFVGFHFNQEQIKFDPKTCDFGKFCGLLRRNEL